MLFLLNVIDGGNQRLTYTQYYIFKNPSQTHTPPHLKFIDSNHWLAALNSAWHFIKLIMVTTKCIFLSR